MLDTTIIRQEVLQLIDETKKWQVKRPEYRDTSIEVFCEQMKSRFEYLFTNSSTLFERCIKGDLNMEQFNYMISMIEKVNAGKDYNTASTEIGQKLVDVYVKPLIDEKDKKEKNNK
jgi:hypothetical protein